MPDNEKKRQIAPEASQSSAEVYDQQQEPTVSENDRIVDRLERVVTDLATLEECLTPIDPVGQLYAFRDFMVGDVRLPKLKCLAADQQRGLDIFEVLQIHHMESVHSNFLAWLLNPQQNHAIGSHFLQNFLSRTVWAAQEQDIPTVSLDKIHAIDWSETEVRREWHYIDILILNRKAGFVCAVENKVWAEEGIGDDGVSQLTGYRETLDREFPDFESHLVFLSPRGMDSRSKTERRHWVTEDYTTIRQLALQTLEDTTGKASPEVQWFLTQYETTLRRNIVPNDSEIGELARQIYLEHREAIELINSYKPNYAADIKQILKEAISQQDGWVLDEEGGAYVRFRSSNWDRFEALRKGSGWGTSPALLLFEIYCPTSPVGTLGTALTLGPGTDDALRQRLIEAARQNPRVFRPRQSSLQSEFTLLNDYSENPLDDSDLGARWADGSTRIKLLGWVKRLVENDLPIIAEAIVRCLEEYEAAPSELVE